MSETQIVRFYFSDKEVLIVVAMMSLATDEPSASVCGYGACPHMHRQAAAGEPTERRRARRSLAAKKARQQPSELRGAR